MRIVLALMILFSAGSKYVERDLDRIEAQYLVIAPPAFAESLDLLLDHRSKTLKAAVAGPTTSPPSTAPGPKAWRS